MHIPKTDTPSKTMFHGDFKFTTMKLDVNWELFVNFGYANPRYPHRSC